MKRLVLLVALLASSCVSNRWHDYDTSSQNVVMDPTEQRYNEHIALLESWAGDTEHPMPPGLYAELAYWLAKVGRFSEADAALQKELAAYPQAQQFVAALRALMIPDDVASMSAPAATAPASDEVQP